MAKYTLVYEGSYDKSKITFEFVAHDIRTLLPQIESFIRTSGYSYIEGDLDFVKSDYDSDERFQTRDLPFDTDIFREKGSY
jgi:hypothetical protein